MSSVVRHALEEVECSRVGWVPHLREHAIAPDPDLASHIRVRNFAVPDVSDSAKRTGGNAVFGRGERVSAGRRPPVGPAVAMS